MYCGELYRQGTCAGEVYILVGRDKRQTNKRNNFTVDKYAKDDKQGNVSNGRSANLNRMETKETVTVEPTT